jgi:DNA-directed RNA polymerase specialized sigma24 family protein
MTAQTEQLLAEVAEELRRPLLAANRRSAAREDLEDIYAQSVLELLLRIRRDPSFTTHEHLANALRLRFASRLADRHRALAGRSPASRALAQAARLDDDATVIVAAYDVEHTVLGRERLRALITALHALPASQRDAVLAERATGDTERKRCWRGRCTLRASIDGL